ncbi:MAG: hypothetical protein VX954_00220 [Candidatus Thermoplasmatota archaeon]|nr:hypothetical protein [Candidatus Thermoplasmatota archaeon]
MNRGFSGVGLVPIISFLILSSLISPMENGQLESNESRMEQFGGGSGSIEERCGSITFEDMFAYNNAIFNIEIEDGWDKAEVSAVAWINLTLADDIRHDLDAFLEGLVPSGGDGWLSNDEVGIVIMAAADCLEYSITRIGIRDGFPHRGGTGVDWKNTTWEGNGMQVSHFNGVPPSHSQGRECEGFGQGDCYEVPVIPDVERDCDTTIDQSEGLDECRIMLWLNASMEIGGISDPNNFTIGFNASNMSNAELHFTLPPMPDLRLDLWEECEGRHVGPEEDDPGSYESPGRGACVGDGSSTYDLRADENGSLTYSLFPSTNRAAWPIGEDIFADFTTYPLDIDNPPVWTDLAPENGSMFPVPKLGESRFATPKELSSWFYDELGSSLLDVDCEAEGSGGISESIDGSIWVQVQGQVEVSCLSFDAAGQASDSRTWLVGVPISVSTTEDSLMQGHPITITPNLGWSGVTVEMGLFQEGVPSEIVTNTVDQEMVIDVPFANLMPGSVLLWANVYMGNGYKMEAVYDLGISKESLPPVISISSVQWNGALLNIDGQLSDPDGESVTLEVEVDGMVADPATVTYTATGNSWEILLDAYEYDYGNLTIEIKGCDESQKCQSVLREVEYVEWMDSVPPEIEGTLPSGSNDGEGLLPATGALFSILAIFLALSQIRREGES